MKSDWEIKNERLLREGGEGVLPRTPPFPSAANLAEFFVAAPGNRYYVDRSTISVAGLQVNYVMVVRSPSGVDNVSFETLNCKDREFRSNARGTSDRNWLERPTEWRRVRPQADFAQYTLHREYFCPHTQPIRNAAEGVEALARGGHPSSVSIDGSARERR